MCAEAWEAEGRPGGLEILAAPGDGDWLIRWYLRPELTTLLDAHEVPWRQFFAGDCATPPPDARVAILAPAGPAPSS